MRKNIIIALLFILGFTYVSAQSLNECIEYAKAHSLRVKQSSLQVTRSKRNEKSYFQLEKTQLSLSQDPTSGGSPDNALTLSQNIDFPTVYTTRKKMLKAETQVAESQYHLSLREFIMDVTSAYSSLLYYQQQVLLLQQNDSLLDHFVKIAKAKVDNGDANSLELINAQQQKESNLLQLKQAKNNERSTNLRLQQLINTSKSIIPMGDLTSFLEEREDICAIYNYEQSPKGQLMKSEMQLRERELEHTRQGYLPSFSLGWRHQLLISGINPYGIERTRFEKGNWMGFEFGISFPLFFGSQKAKISVAKYDFEIARMRNDEIQKQQETEFSIALQNLHTTKENLEQYKNKLLPQATEMQRLSQVEYEAGEISYIEYIQNLTSVLSIKLQMIDAANEHNKAIITLNYIR